MWRMITSRRAQPHDGWSSGLASRVDRCVRAAAGGSLHDQAVIISGRAVHAFLRSPARGGWCGVQQPGVRWRPGPAAGHRLSTRSPPGSPRALHPDHMPPTPARRRL